MLTAIFVSAREISGLACQQAVIQDGASVPNVMAPVKSIARSIVLQLKLLTSGQILR